MNGNGNPTTKNGQNPVDATQLQIVITWDQMTGKINVQGPLDNTVVFCGMLEAAKDVCFKRMQKMADNSSGIVVAPASLRM